MQSLIEYETYHISFFKHLNYFTVHLKYIHNDYFDIFACIFLLFFPFTCILTESIFEKKVFKQLALIEGILFGENYICWIQFVYFKLGK